MVMVAAAAGSGGQGLVGEGCSNVVWLRGVKFGVMVIVTVIVFVVATVGAAG